jgi:catechol 2,3-dioxygenase-like lactoylglutathione lyase family enzyme
MRLQLALNVKDIDRAVDFYARMLSVEPTKQKPGYANFAISDSPLKLVQFEAPDALERLNHLGVEFFGEEDVGLASQRLRETGMETLIKDETTCCYAKASRVWFTEPDAIRWGGTVSWRLRRASAKRRPPLRSKRSAAAEAHRR